MNDEVAFFIFSMTALIAVSVIVLTLIKTRAQAKAGTGGLEAKREVQLLTQENAGLKGQVGRLEERIAVLERITVEKESTLVREIEQLRNA